MKNVEIMWNNSVVSAFGESLNLSVFARRILCSILPGKAAVDIVDIAMLGTSYCVLDCLILCSIWGKL